MVVLGERISKWGLIGRWLVCCLDTKVGLA